MLRDKRKRTGKKEKRKSLSSEEEDLQKAKKSTPRERKLKDWQAEQTNTCTSVHVIKIERRHMIRRAGVENLREEILDSHQIYLRGWKRK